MALNIKDEETDRLARELAKLTDQSITAALREAIEIQLRTVRSAQQRRASRSRGVLEEIAARGRARSVIDDRTPDEILGYDDSGLPS